MVVEVAGVEPASRESICKLSTCLVCDWDVGCKVGSQTKPDLHLSSGSFANGPEPSR